MASNPLWAVVRSIRDGLSGAHGLREFRSAGGHIATQTWYRVRAEVNRSLSQRINELAAPLNRRPTAAEITRMPTRNATGFIHQMEIVYRVKGTNEIGIRPFSYAIEGVVSRQTAIDYAMGMFGEGVQEGPYGDQEILGVAYTGTYELVPGGI